MTAGFFRIIKRICISLLCFTSPTIDMQMLKSHTLIKYKVVVYSSLSLNRSHLCVKFEFHDVSVNLLNNSVQWWSVSLHKLYVNFVKIWFCRYNPFICNIFLFLVCYEKYKTIFEYGILNGTQKLYWL